MSIIAISYPDECNGTCCPAATLPQWIYKNNVKFLTKHLVNVYVCIIGNVASYYNVGPLLPICVYCQSYLGLASSWTRASAACDS